MFASSAGLVPQFIREESRSNLVEAIGLLYASAVAGPSLSLPTESQSCDRVRGATMKLSVVSLAALALGTLGAVNAQGMSEVVVTSAKAPTPGTQVRSKTVAYSDLDLSKSSGLTTLLGRIRGAASDVCSPGAQSKDIKDSADYKKCVSDAVNSAVAKVNNPGLTALVPTAAH
jgi:UrcA family protein